MFYNDFSYKHVHAHHLFCSIYGNERAACALPVCPLAQHLFRSLCIKSVACALRLRPLSSTICAVAYAQKTLPVRYLYVLCANPRLFLKERLCSFWKQVLSIQNTPHFFTVSDTVETASSLQKMSPLAKCGKHLCTLSHTVQMLG